MMKLVTEGLFGILSLGPTKPKTLSRMSFQREVEFENIS